jgi:hypothetical protein
MNKQPKTKISTNITIDAPLWHRAKQDIGDGNLSNTINTLLKNYLNHNEEEYKDLEIERLQEEIQVRKSELTQIATTLSTLQIELQKKQNQQAEDDKIEAMKNKAFYRSAINSGILRNLKV